MSGIVEQTQHEIWNRVIVRHESTLEQEAAQFDIATLLTTVVGNLRAMQSTVSTLPDATFATPSRTTGDGEIDWLAGKIVSHVCEIQRRICDQAANLMGYTEAEAILGTLPELPDTINREEALAGLSTSEQTQLIFNEHLPEDAPLSHTTEHPRFGTIGPRGLLLLQVIHSHTHINQLDALRA